MIAVRPVEPTDAEEWLAMRSALWPEGSVAEHREEIEAFFAGTFPRGPWAVFFARDAQARAAGFVEVSVRPYAEGCVTSRVAYLEGWFVVEDARGSGVGGALVKAAESWGREQGCTEFASDADPENATSVAAHRALGFEDVGLVRCFRKNL